MRVPPSPPSDDDPPFNGDPTWQVTRTLRDGSPVTVRPVAPEDREELRREFLALSPQSMYLRFLHLTSPTEALLTYLTSVDQDRHVAIGATVPAPDLKTERGVGIARFIRLEGLPDTAEAAITVADDMQHKGVGTVLLRELLRAAQARGIKTLRAEVLENNATMRTILERAGARRVEPTGNDGTLTYDLAIDDREPRASSLLFDILRAVAEMAMHLRR